MTGSRSSPRVFSIPSGVPFLTTLAEALLTDRIVAIPQGDPLALAGVTILLPTRRAVRAFRDVLIERLGAGAAILPAIRPIGDVDEEDHLLDPAVEANADRVALPAAISRLARQLTLTRLTLFWGQGGRREMMELGPGEPLLIPASAADATRLAGDLARLLDDMETAQIPWERIRDLAPEDHARYFQVTLDFLKIVAEHWPAHLAEIGRVDPIVRRDVLIGALAERLQRRAPPSPIIAAGSTGSIPATANLLRVIARLPNGAVVLPGLDHDLDEAGWAAIGTNGEAAKGHPQFGLKQLVGEIGVSRKDVVELGAPAAAIGGRTRLLSEAMRPADTVEAWVPFRAGSLGSAGEALSGIDLIAARNEQEEALAIALAIREAMENPGGKVALVTPDRGLARRVATELGRWGLAIDDSAGAPLDRLPQGVFARLLVEAALSDADPVGLLALLKHPFAGFGMNRADCRAAARVLELAIFRGKRIVGGFAALASALVSSEREVNEKTRHLPQARRRLSERDWRLAGTLVTRVAEVLSPIEAALQSSKPISAAAATKLLLDSLIKSAEDEARDTGPLWHGPEGEALARLMAGIIEPGSGGDVAFPPAEYPFFLAALMSGVPVQRQVGADPRIHIWGTLEARLQSVDLLILSGLDEGVWPAETRTDPWLSRAMRAELGLPAPERRLGLAAHDFVQGMSAPRVIVTRADKRGGAPTVASRWIQRLLALIGDDEAKHLIERGQRLVEMARALDYVPRAGMKPIERPAPKPPVAVRPRALSVTEIETLIRDPYAIYAKHVLRLQPLDPLGLAPDRALRGTLIHDALGKFTSEWTGDYDPAAEARLVALARDTLAAIKDFPDLLAVWSLRFGAIARWFTAWEAARSSLVARRGAEVEGRLEVQSPGGIFNLRGRADRIDLMADGTVAIFDFKTSTPQTERTVFAGLTPQMTLEAAMVRGGGFGQDLMGRSVSDLAWLAVGKAGRGEPYISAVRKGETADGLADRAAAMLDGLVQAFDDADKPYLSRARPMMERARYLGDYDHLARVREWAVLESEDDVA